MKSGRSAAKDSISPEALKAPLVVTLGQHGHLIDMVGSTSAFGSLAKEDIVRLLLDLTVGSDSPAEVLQAVELVDGYFVDIHIVCEDDLKHFVLLDASELMRTLQRSQQVNNEAALRKEDYTRSLRRKSTVSEDQSREQKLSQVRMGGGAFSAMVSEMRAPLALLSGHVAMLSRHCRNDPVALRSLVVMHRAAMQLDALSSSGLVVMGESLVDSGGTGTADLRRLAASILDVFSIQSEGLGVDLIIHVPETQMTVEIDGQYLRQVLVNLVTHAFVGVKQGRLELTLSVSSLHLEVELNAEPEGFSPELFGPLVTTNDLLHSNAAGSLVLAISQRILWRMDAMIEIVPRKEGGCVLWFRLPMRQRSSSADALT